MKDEEKLKVLHVYRTYFPDPPGGLQEAIKQISLSVKKHGVESRVFTLSPQPVPSVIEIDGDAVVRGKSVIAPASCDISDLKSLALFKKQVEWSDIVHFHFPWPFGDVLSFLVPDSKPKIMTYHSDIVRQKFLGLLYRPLMKNMFKKMDKIVVTSDNYALTSETIKSYIEPKSIKVIPLGISDDSFPSSVGREDDILEKLGIERNNYVLTLGVVRYYKGIHTLIETAKALPTIKFVVGGSGPESDNLKIAASGCSNIIFAGQLTERDKHALLKNCKVFSLTSHLRSEAFGMVLVEASIYSKPMITCEIGTGTTFVNKDGVTGIAIEPENHEMLQQAVVKLFNNESLAAQYGNNARLRYEKLFSQYALGCSYSSVYREIIKNHI